MKLFKTPLLTIAALSLVAAVPTTASAAVTKEECAAQFGLGGSDDIATVMQSVTPESLQGGARSYQESLKDLLVMPSTVPTFVSSLPKKKPTAPKAKAAYEEKADAELAKRKALADRAEDKLKDLYKDARKDITDSAAERTLAIKNNSTLAKNRLTNLKKCNEWNAEADFITDTRTKEDGYKSSLIFADDLYLNGDLTEAQRAEFNRILEATGRSGAIAIPAAGQLQGTRDVEDKYRQKAQVEAGEDIKQQKQCSQDASYGYVPNPDHPDDPSQVQWKPRAVTVPKEIVGMDEATARNTLTDTNGQYKFQDVVVKQVKFNSKKIKQGQVINTNPAVGSRILPETQITLLIRSNEKKEKGLKPGRIASASDGAVIAKSGKGKGKGKGKKLPKKVDTSRPTEDQVKECQDNQENDPLYGNTADKDQAKTELTRELADTKELYRNLVEATNDNYKREVDDLRRDLKNPFKFVVPYNDAITSLKQMTRVTELRSKRQKTEDDRSARDAAKAARDYLTDLYGFKVSI